MKRRNLTNLATKNVKRYLDKVKAKKIENKVNYGDLEGILKIIGNGSFEKGLQFLYVLAGYIKQARIKHKHFAKGSCLAFDVIYDEVEELKKAILYEGHERSISEALDVIVTSIRFINGEHFKN